MKKVLFDNYVEFLLKNFHIQKEQLFAKDKYNNNAVDARQMLYYCCYKRAMHIALIEKFMAEYGYIIKYNSIMHGIVSMGKKISKDSDYKRLSSKMLDM